MLRTVALGPDDWRTWRALRLRALADSPHAFGARLADWLGDGDREQRWRARLTSVAVNLVGNLDGRPAGIASVTAPDPLATAEIISVWVDPAARGSGLSDALITAALEEARRMGARRAVLAVVDDNTAADRLYRRHGFRDVLRDGRAQVEDGERRMELLL